MKTITETELKNILDQHKLWVATGSLLGQRADLSGADLKRSEEYTSELQSRFGIRMPSSA